MTLYILRHGQTEFNRLGIVQGSGVDTELNQVGHKQASAFFKKHRHVDFELVVTSRLRRTHQTVQGFLDQNIPWEQTADLNEICWGIHEGQPHTETQTTRYLAMIAEWQRGNLDAALPAGESARELLERLSRFVEWVKQRSEKRILVATHGRAMRCLITHMKGLPPTAMETAEHTNTGLYVAHWRDGAWHFEMENDVSHLTEGS